MNEKLWEYDEQLEEVLDGDRYPVAEEVLEPENGYLLAAAPEMYEALKEMLSALKNVVNINYMSDSAFAFANDAMVKAEKALKKARGER